MTAFLRRQTALVAASIALVAGLPLPELSAHQPVSSRFTYSRDVLPILRSRCLACHCEHGIAPMALSTYRDAKTWASAIRAALLAGEMPPWPSEGDVALAGEGTATAPLAGRELDVLLDWSSGGAPEGEPATPVPPEALAPAPAREDGTLVLPLPEEVVLPLNEVEKSVEVLLDPGVDRDRWLRSWELRPGERAALRDAWITLERDGAPPEPLGAWTPALGSADLGADAGRLIARGVRVRLSLHYRRAFQNRGRELRDRSALALRFHAGEPARRARVEAWGPLAPGGTFTAERRLRLRALLARVPPARVPIEGAASAPWELRLSGGAGGASSGARLLVAVEALRLGWPAMLRPLEPPELEPGARLSLEREGKPLAVAPAEIWLEFDERARL